MGSALQFAKYSHVHYLILILVTFLPGRHRAVYMIFVLRRGKLRFREHVTCLKPSTEWGFKLGSLGPEFCMPFPAASLR